MGTVPATGLYLRADGTWFHDGQEVTHARLAALLHRCIARGAAGEPVVTTGRDVMAFTCEDTPLRVLSARVDGERVLLALSHQHEQPLQEATLEVDGDGSWRCQSTEGLAARFTRAAVLMLADHVDEDAAGGHLLRVGGRAIPLRPRPR